MEASHPQPASKSILSQVAKLSPVGQCLQAALTEDLNDSCNINDNSDNTNSNKEVDEKEEGTMMLTEEMALEIENAFGLAVASCWSSSSSSTASNTTKTKTKTKTQEAKLKAKLHAPAGLLRGRVKHYNRVGKQWRIVISDAQMRRRCDLNPKKKHRQRKSLWEHCDDKDTQGYQQHEAAEISEKEEVVDLKGEVEILAYDDAS